ncbi:hypothetical protein GXB81_05570 [Paraburkholderia sp. Ac-20336]|uniref:hypothetical protein n=1 Tax=Paraburkholderia sp. Ac-20336 TaxID=2703886 RepID=UPI0019802545|nr:hypothetical protein [Paraburkholderia sp. Ac-20336]MBN3802524.1 hypothetical protein [Paraburkholderia sp. Ac-20336]
MARTYHYKGFELKVAIESNFRWQPQIARTPAPTYVAVVTIARAAPPVAIFSPLRLGDADGKAFSTEGDALMTGYSAARRIVDDLLAVETYG